MNPQEEEPPVAGASAPASRKALDGIVVVLWETQDHVNVAGTIRAMKNFGLSRLRLVSPASWDPWRIEGIAHDTREIIDATAIHGSLSEALADASYVVGMTARPRRAKRPLSRPREIAPEILSRGLTAVAGEAGPVALLFGREDHGLSNEALDLCHRNCIIPTGEYRSLNLAQAALVVFYELWMAAEGAIQPFRAPRHASPPATVKELELLFGDIEAALWKVDFFKSRQTESVLRSARELVRRTELDRREAHLLRAIFIEVRKFVERKLGG
ncbi:MAG: TrmJ/YjtD family RNA methyltransferase [Gemmatimonadota bacterium]|nr:TrmJ/YjtD family RNA methyltransferase [Gemmatimonadota bacterium]